MRGTMRSAMRISVATSSVTAWSARLISDRQLRRRSPQPFQVIVGARLFAEHMHNETPKIQQRPFRRAPPFAVLRRPPQLFVELLLDLTTDGLHLRRAETRADHEVRRKRAHSAEIEH